MFPSGLKRNENTLHNSSSKRAGLKCKRTHPIIWTSEGHCKHCEEIMMDISQECMKECTGKGAYRGAIRLPYPTLPEDVCHFAKCWGEWVNTGIEGCILRMQNIPYLFFPEDVCRGVKGSMELSLPGKEGITKRHGILTGVLRTPFHTPSPFIDVCHCVKGCREWINTGHRVARERKRGE